MWSAMRREGKTNREIGERFGIDHGYVSRIMSAFRSEFERAPQNDQEPRPPQTWA
jgi:hypothetical protein